MTDSELNEAIFREVETDDVRTTNYCNDPAWCVQRMEKHGLQTFRDCDAWEITDGEEVLGRDTSLTRAVALAVLQLTREGK